ncbi:hypothetical protein K7432_013009, partial [Basidiobolus ranarum]
MTRHGSRTHPIRQYVSIVLYCDFRLALTVRRGLEHAAMASPIAIMVPCQRVSQHELDGDSVTE